MKLSVEQIPREGEEEVIVRCYDAREKWVEAVRAATEVNKQLLRRHGQEKQP